MWSPSFQWILEFKHANFFCDFYLFIISVERRIRFIVLLILCLQLLFYYFPFFVILLFIMIPVESRIFEVLIPINDGDPFVPSQLLLETVNPLLSSTDEIYWY